MEWDGGDSGCGILCVLSRFSVCSEEDEHKTGNEKKNSAPLINTQFRPGK